MRNNRSGISKFGDSEHSLFLSKNYAPLQYLLYFKAQRYHRFHLFLGNFILWDDFKRDILHDSHLDAVLKTTFKAFSQCLYLNESPKSLNF
jgi:hypothetical protein